MRRVGQLETLCACSIRCLFIVTLLVFAVAGCGKRSDPKALQADSPVPASVNPDNPGQDPVALQMRINIDQMNRELQRFFARHNRAPTNFEEFRRTVDGVPFPPSGKQWVIDSETRTIKLVPAK
jgi:hypothetical protein